MASRRKDLAFLEYRSPLGPLLLLFTEKGLARLAFDGHTRWRDQEIGRVAKKIGISGGVPRLKDHPIRKELGQYFAGGSQNFRTSIDLALSPDFASKVLRHLQRLSPGAFTTYGELARKAGRPGAARAVGQCVGSNPIPVVVPCHRVVAADGSLGGYSGGLPRKRALLRLEGLEVPPGGWPPRKRR